MDERGLSFYLKESRFGFYCFSFRVVMILLIDRFVEWMDDFSVGFS